MRLEEHSTERETTPFYSERRGGRNVGTLSVFSIGGTKLRELKSHLIKRQFFFSINQHFLSSARSGARVFEN